MEPTTQRSRHTFFKVYVSIILTIIVLLQVALIALLIYGGMRLADTAKTLSTKVDTFSSKVDTLNQNLNALDTTSSLYRH